MSINLARDNCDCGYVFEIQDFTGQPCEFRQYQNYRPMMGVKLVCPDCGKVYFGWIRSGFNYWHNKKDAFKDELTYAGHTFKNEQKGQFVEKQTNYDGKEHIIDLGYYQIDISYYESFSDEGIGKDTDNPPCLCTKDDEKTRWYQTNKI